MQKTTEIQVMIASKLTEANPRMSIDDFKVDMEGVSFQDIVDSVHLSKNDLVICKNDRHKYSIERILRQRYSRDLQPAIASIRQGNDLDFLRGRLFEKVYIPDSDYVLRGIGDKGYLWAMLGYSLSKSKTNYLALLEF